VKGQVFKKQNWVIILSCLIGLVGCQSVPDVTFDDDKVTGMPLPKTVDGASDAKVAKLKSKLQEDGVKVITVGQDYLVSMPSHLLFYADTPRIRWQSFAVLNDVANYLTQFRKVSMSVIAHTARIGDEKRNRSLSVARARNVANYLSSQAIDARFVAAQGLGSEKPIVNNAASNAVAQNSRVEITFRNVII